MGKYDALLPSLPKLQPEDLAYQARVEKVKETLAPNATPADLATGYANARRDKDRINEQLSIINLRIAAYEQLLAASQEAEEEGWGAYGAKPNAIRLSNGDVVRIQREPQGKVIDKEAFRQWCIANGYERQLQLWPSTMNALVKERLLAGDPTPEGCEVGVYDKVVFEAFKAPKAE